MKSMHPRELTRRQLLGSVAALAAPALVSSSALAQDKFPARPISLIAPWPAGGGSDAVMRAFAESASRALGVQVIIDNKPGAGGTLGATAMLSAKPDGYTVTQLPLGVYRLPHMQKTPYNPVKDLTHIVGLTGYTFGIVANADVPFKTLNDMVTYAKANPGKLEYGSTGTGTGAGGGNSNGVELLSFGSITAGSGNINITGNANVAAAPALAATNSGEFAVIMQINPLLATRAP
jgi:hypothetical protein